MQRLVGDLLHLSRLQNADFIIEKEVLSFNNLIDDAIRSAMQMAHKKQIQFQIQKDHSDFIFSGDYGRLRQMLLVVLDNAVKFSPMGGKIDVMFKDQILTVRDYGSGIKEEELPYIFDRFYKAHTEDNKSGTGLGLAIAKQIADRHQIKIKVQNIGGNGVAFSFDMNNCDQTHAI